MNIQLLNAVQPNLHDFQSGRFGLQPNRLLCETLFSLTNLLQKVIIDIGNPRDACHHIFNLCMEDLLKRLSHFWRGPVRDFWKTGKAGFALFLISVFVSIYGYIALDYEVVKGWKGHESVQNVVKDISAFIPVGGVFVGMIVGGIDLIMLLSDWYLSRQEKRIEAAKAEGKAEGKAEVYREILDWDRRRREAEDRGEEFTEPPPGASQNGSE